MKGRFRRTAEPQVLPMPPLELRRLVGPTREDWYDNPKGQLVFPKLPASAYESVFDFGCGCGRVARMLIQQEPRPARYVGIDLHRELIKWCNKNLAPHAPGFEFHHHDVFNFHFNPDAKARELPFPIEDGSFTLVNATSVFTHLTQEQTPHYLRETARVLRPNGVLHSTWFLFEGTDFPMLSPENGAIYVSYVDPSAAVVYAREWLARETAAAGLTIVDFIPPPIRGYHWTLYLAPSRPGLEPVTLPPDTAPAGEGPLPGIAEEP